MPPALLIVSSSHHSPADCSYCRLPLLPHLLHTRAAAACGHGLPLPRRQGRGLAQEHPRRAGGQLRNSVRRAGAAPDPRQGAATAGCHPEGTNALCLHCCCCTPSDSVGSGSGGQPRLPVPVPVPLLLSLQIHCCLPASQPPARRRCTRHCGRKCLSRSARCCTPSALTSMWTTCTRWGGGAVGRGRGGVVRYVTWAAPGHISPPSNRRRRRCNAECIALPCCRLLPANPPACLPT